jgi:hypothetical protein
VNGHHATQSAYWVVIDRHKGATDDRRNGASLKKYKALGFRQFFLRGLKKVTANER